MTQLKTLKDIEGKTIKKVWREKIKEEYDDEPYLFIEFIDGSVIKITSDYGGYTGNSEDEYPRLIKIEEADLQTKETKQ